MWAAGAGRYAGQLLKAESTSLLEGLVLPLVWMSQLRRSLEKGIVSAVLPCLQEEWPLLMIMALPSTCHSAMLAPHLAGTAAATASRAHC